MSGLIRKLVMVGLLALLLAAPVPAANGAAKLPGYQEGWFVRNSPLDLGPGADAAMLQKASAEGAKIARFNVQWCALEPQPDTWDSAAWQTVINRLNEILDAGMKPLPILISAPTWARPWTDPDHMLRPCDVVSPARAHSPTPVASNVTQWKQFISMFIACMQGAPGCPASQPDPTLETKLQGYEIWNEPNLNAFWGTEDGKVNRVDADFFAQMLGASFDAANARGATRPIILGGLSYPHDDGWGSTRVGAADYLREVYAYFGGQPKFDTIGVHPYGNHLHTNATIATSEVSEIRTVRDNHNDNAHIYVTEVGDDGCPIGDPPDCSWDGNVQADRLVAIWRQLDTPVIIFYRLVNAPCVDNNGDGKYDFPCEAQHMGVLTWNPFLGARPAYCRLATEWGRSPLDC